MINFSILRYKNILSTGNVFTEIRLNSSANTLIVGKNGAGKSTMLDALCFALFGKPFRKINKPNLLNSINLADGLVEVEFSIGTKQYKIIRGIKPNIFEIYCNDILLNQDAKAKDYQEYLEKVILKLNFKSFTQVVILGSASFIPFMQLSASDRRSIIEDLLDIQIFSSMNNLVKEKISDIKDSTGNNKYELNITSEKIKLQKQNIDEHKKYNDEEIERKLAEIATSELQNERLSADVIIIQKHIDILLQKINDKLQIESKSKKMILMEAKLESSIKKIDKDIAFYEQNDDCPICRQILDVDFKSKQIDDRKIKKHQIHKGVSEISEELAKLNARISEIHQINTNIIKHNNEIVKHNSTISAINQYINKINREIILLSNRKDTIENENENLNLLSDQLKALITEQEKLSIEKYYYEYASNLLKDTGIKTKIIKQYLPVMNTLINNYLSSMDFFVNFNIDENFDETIKSRHRDDFRYSNFSEGEKQKIDLALLLTWRQIAKLKNSTNTNLLILDEIFDSSLDESSMENLFKIFNEFDKDTNLFVISHRGDQLFDRFRSIITFEKQGNFSRISKI
ncbi:endonuclease subunit [uncultured Caudovirales phage]|uniref:Endonuclease subunit n=1 Tax=uncultured Caudovirales phage TaxID=2100421 RepID=A0A6J5T4T0_9CAUD|nr:endonuclease subunit [uncultured Caudovirales phage]